MKTLFVALILGLLFSTNVQADKTEITAVWTGGDVDMQSCSDLGCTFGCTSAFLVSYYSRKDTVLGLQLLVGDQDVVSLASWVLPDNARGTVSWRSGCFLIPFGEDFTMTWVLESTRNGRIIDAREVMSGTCVQ